MSLRYHLDALIYSPLKGSNLIEALAKLLRFPKETAQLAHSKKDRLTGRLAMGLQLFHTARLRFTMCQQ